MKKFLIVGLGIVLSTLIYGEEKMLNKMRFIFDNREIVVTLEKIVLPKVYWVNSH